MAAGRDSWRNALRPRGSFSRARTYWGIGRALHLAFLDTDSTRKGLRAEYERALRETDARVMEVLRWVSCPADEGLSIPMLMPCTKTQPPLHADSRDTRGQSQPQISAPRYFSNSCRTYRA